MKSFRSIVVIVFLFIVLLGLTLYNTANAQAVKRILFDFPEGFSLKQLQLEADQILIKATLPLITFELNDSLFSSADFRIESEFADTLTGSMNDLLLRVYQGELFNGSLNYFVVFVNLGADTINISNVVPLGVSPQRVYITSTGPWSLTRAKLFRPGLAPVSVILPDNAWELGYGTFQIKDDVHMAALARRVGHEGSIRRRYHTIMPPGSSVTYRIYFETYQGDWQNGITHIFRDKYLYDLAAFDNTLFERHDLSWIRHKYMLSCTYAWDFNFYDRHLNRYRYEEYLVEGKKYFGGFDGFILWPTWPILGLDHRNQWDLYYDLPGGIEKVSELSARSRELGTAFFISYNPWDLSTQNQAHLEGMAKLIKETGADGVILDTRGASSRELQDAADAVKPGVVMYSEGMAVVKDMPGIVSGRVHDAIFLSPVLNLNKLIKPDFAIFRVLQLSQGRIKREVDISFFNGYGFELNTFAPGRPEWMPEEFHYMGRLLKILRENSNAFINKDFIPLITTIRDSVYVNQWSVGSKRIYTIYSLVPEGVDQELIEVSPDEEQRMVDLFNHEPAVVIERDGRQYVRVNIPAFDKAFLGTRSEGNIGCIARFDRVINSRIEGGDLLFEASAGDSLLLWAGNPSYQNSYVKFKPGIHRVNIREIFFRYEGKFVLQLFRDGQLSDETIEYLEPGMPRLISRVEPTERASTSPMGMVEIPGGDYYFYSTYGERFIPYPQPDSYKTRVGRFFMDIYPVTNNDFHRFLSQSGYVPADTINFLKHWKNRQPDQQIKGHPVVYVSIGDASAYCAWAGKRLPTEVEWQFAGQGTDSVAYPWGMEPDSLKCNSALGHTTPVKAFPEGKSRFGVQDMIGNVWQLTGDVYDNGAYQFVMMKGGSHFNPTDSWWYVRGGPQPLHYRQMLLQVSEGFERNSTVGFRCVKDAR